jgi:acyl transferase domain-containing protein/acyl-CoA synthetase (AMP-forming)/AMP-acid ligase II/NAD(P)-dependent dehydrogenase (short-subunit alcohol dehydrogenase family)/acyl carrier protein
LVTCYEADGRQTQFSYASFRDAVETLAANLVALGLRKGDSVLMQTEGTAETLLTSWACFAAGITAAPMAPVLNFDPDTAPLRRLKAVHAMLGQPLVIASGRYGAQTAKALDAKVITFNDPKLQQPRDFTPPAMDPSDVILLPTTSGSTGTPKAVPLTHRNIMAMCSGTIQDNQFDTADCALNWMPLDHPGALVFLSVVPLAAGAGQVHLPTSTVLGDPLRWLTLTQEYRASISWAPNFAFALLTEALKNTAHTFDVSSLRFLVSAGEHVAPDTLRGLLGELAKHGFPEGGLRPAFGMAETCSGITWSPGLHLEDISAETGLSVVSLGGPIPGAELKITDDADQVLTEGEIGSLQMRGSSVFEAYLDNPDANATSRMPDGWFKTGDHGYLQNGELFITGRDSEMLVINGLNVPPHDIERAAATVEGVSDTNICCFATRSATGATDDIVLIFASDAADLPALTVQMRGQVAREVGVRVARFVIMEPRDISKTSIGKIQRATLKAAFEAGDLTDRVVAEPVPAKPTGAVDQEQSDAVKKVLSVWSELLGQDLKDPQTNFFDVGGHSLLLIQGHAQLRTVYPSLEIVDLFTHATPASLAAFLAKEDTAQAASDRPRTKRAATPDGSGDIAVIGMACRFPGANTVEEFWDNLIAKREAITQFSVDDLLAAGFDRATVTHPDFVRASPVLDDHKGFDAGLFGYSRREAEMMDPQQRLFLHVAWECLEQAGYSATASRHRIGAYIGSNINSYFLNNVWPNRDLLDAQDSMDVYTPFSLGGFQAMVANDKDYIATRTSFKLGLTGPSLNTQTACSTGLVLIHQAVRALRAGECDMIMAGTSSVLSPVANGHLWQEGMIVSKDGHCRAFDTEATGTIFGSGVGAVLLRPLQDALDAGDHIYAVIKGTAVNNDGNDKVGFMAPSVAGQKEVAEMALADAQIAPASVTFVEAHGTGTPLGDPVEMTSLRAAYSDQDGPDTVGSRYMGAVKTNVGHLQISSGIAGFIKSALAVYHGQIPATLHFNTPNPALKYADGPFEINTETCPWPEADGGPRRAGVNSLGIGGTNAHVVLEQPPVPQVATQVERPGHVVQIHAQTDAGLAQVATKLADWLEDSPDVDAGDLAYSFNVGRKALGVSAAFAFQMLDELRLQLAECTGQRGTTTSLALDVTVPTMAPGFGQDVLDSSPRFAGIVAEIGAAVFVPQGLPTLGDVISGAEMPEDHAALYRDAMALAMGRLWLSWGFADVTCIGQALDLPQMPLPLGQEPDQAVTQSVVPQNGKGPVWPYLLKSIAELVNKGVAVDWEAFDADYARRRIPLPTYPFDAEPYWLDPPAKPQQAATTSGFFDHVAASERQAEDLYSLTFDLNRHAYVADHLIGGVPVVPGAAFVAMVLVAQSGPCQISNLVFEQALPLGLTEDTPPHQIGAEVRLIQRKTGDFILLTPADDRVIATGHVGPTTAPSTAVPASSYEPLELATYHARLQNLGIQIGPRFQAFAQLGVAELSARAQLTLPQGAATQPGQLHPALIDAGFALMLAACTPQLDSSGTFLPSEAAAVILHKTPDGAPLVAAGRFECSTDGRRAKGDILISTDRGVPVFEVRGLVGVAAPLSALVVAPKTQHLVTVAWHPAQAGHDTLSYVGNDPAFGPAISLAAGLADHDALCVDLRGTSIGDGLQVVQTCLSVLETEPQKSLRLLTENASTAADAAGIWGLVKVARHEFPELRLHCTDLATDPSPADIALAMRGGDGDFAIRDGAILRPTLSPLNLPSGPITLDPEKAYLVTGASGAVAQTVMGWLLDHGAQQIIAVSRSGVVSDAVAALAAESGAELIHVASDLTDPSFALPAIPIGGVFHTAGVLHDATLAKTTVADVEAVAAPKLAGLHAVLAQLDQAKVDHIVLFSSAASLIGNPGQGAYSAVNAMLDATARQLRQDGWPCTAVSWGPWVGQGMAHQSDKTMERFDKIGIKPLDHDTGLAGLAAVLGSDQAHVGCIACDWDTYVATTGSSPTAYLAPLLTAPVATTAPSAQSGLAELPADERLTQVTAAVADIIATSLNVPAQDVVPDRPLSELGLDSLGNLDVRRGLNDRFDHSFTIGMFFEYPTLAGLAGFVDQTVFGTSEPVAPGPSVAVEDVDIDALDLDALTDLVRDELDI